MKIEKYIDGLKEAISWANGADIEEPIREVMRRAFKAELLKAEEEIEEAMLHERQGRPWSKEDLTLLENTLKGKTANSWGEERINIGQAAMRLRRSETSTKKKAVEMGYARAVDYWSNHNE